LQVISVSVLESVWLTDLFISQTAEIESTNPLLLLP